jgi:hypothetical protein
MITIELRANSSDGPKSGFGPCKPILSRGFGPSRAGVDGTWTIVLGGGTPDSPDEHYHLGHLVGVRRGQNANLFAFK